MSKPKYARQSPNQQQTWNESQTSQYIYTNPSTSMDKNFCRDPHAVRHTLPFYPEKRGLQRAERATSSYRSSIPLPPLSEVPDLVIQAEEEGRENKFLNFRTAQIIKKRTIDDTTADVIPNPDVYEPQSKVLNRQNSSHHSQENERLFHHSTPNFIENKTISLDILNSTAIRHFSPRKDIKLKREHITKVKIPEERNPKIIRPPESTLQIKIEDKHFQAKELNYSNLNDIQKEVAQKMENNRFPCLPCNDTVPLSVPTDWSLNLLYFVMICVAAAIVCSLGMFICILTASLVRMTLGWTCRTWLFWRIAPIKPTLGTQIKIGLLLVITFCTFALYVTFCWLTRTGKLVL